MTIDSNSNASPFSFSFTCGTSIHAYLNWSFDAMEPKHIIGFICKQDICCFLGSLNDLIDLEIVAFAFSCSQPLLGGEKGCMPWLLSRSGGFTWIWKALIPLWITSPMEEWHIDTLWSTSPWTSRPYLQCTWTLSPWKIACFPIYNVLAKELFSAHIIVNFPLRNREAVSSIPQTTSSPYNVPAHDYWPSRNQAILHVDGRSKFCCLMGFADLANTSECAL